MVDDETQDVSARPAGAPPNRDARPDPGVIDGEIGPNEREPPPSAAGAPESAAQPRPAPAPRAGFRGVLAGALAGLVVSALAVGAFYSLLAPGADVEDSANRLAELGAQVQQANAALDAEAKLDQLGQRIPELNYNIGVLLQAQVSALSRFTACVWHATVLSYK